jgi:hypothetical protein
VATYPLGGTSHATWNSSRTSVRSGHLTRGCGRLTDTVAVTGVRRILFVVDGAGDAAPTVDNVARLGAEVLARLRS